MSEKTVDTLIYSILSGIVLGACLSGTALCLYRIIRLIQGARP